MAVPIDFLINSPHESSDDDFSEYESSYSSEDESMEDEPSDDINGGSLSNLEQKQEPNGAEDELWVRYPYFKMLVDAVIAQGLVVVTRNDAFELAKLLGDDKAKELNEKWKDLCSKQLDLCSQMFGVLASAISSMKSGI
ncbi:unnamed protein product [Microthlaspi erraticum]|uniref:Uncharacterized protein n=1 Tax=Microthlaspi erraticum TaxID=1685480 RepID=A0A6D2IP91_9BRAS|nr:unnamed protein product [Microthlaspi erraticum]